MRKPELMEYLDDLTDGVLRSVPEENNNYVFLDCCPCCGKPLIIKRDGIYYTVEAFNEIDFNDGGDTDERENKERKRCVDIL